MKMLKSRIFRVFLISATMLLSFCVINFFKLKEPNISYAASENQTETTEFLKKLVASNENLAFSYMQTNDYIIDAENQLSTDFCWLFASLKCLESSFMIQRNEYYNFSETGMAYLNYISNIAGGQSTFDTTGNLLKFNTLASNSGLIFENDVSNDLMMQINETNYKNYSYISNFASKSLYENTKVVSFGQNPYFSSSLSYNQKILAMKKFIKNYGALFIAFGDGDGVIFKTAGLPQYDYSSAEHLGEEHISINRHSVCLIGWNATGFIALNSWGDSEGAYQIFCIPYATGESRLDELISTVRGFIVGENNYINLNFGSDNFQKNIFESNEEVDLLFNVNKTYDINEIAIQIYKGSEDVLSNFEILFDDENYNIRIRDKFKSSSDNFGGYVVKFLHDDKVIASNSFLVLSGTEVSSVSLLRKQAVNSYIQENLALTSSFLNGNNTATYLIDPYDEYKIRFSLSNFSKCNFDESDPEFNRFKNGTADALFQISSVKVQSIVSDSSIWLETNLAITKSIIDYDTNTFEFSLPTFFGINEQYRNRLISFDIILNSTTGNGVQEKFTFMFFVGLNDGDNTSQNLSINYQLNGGKNAQQNITNFPNFQYNNLETEFILQNPTKNGYNFLGWYIDKDFGQQIYKISKDMIADIVLYAKWDSAEVDDYIITDIEIFALKNFDKVSKDLDLGIEYGDTITFVYKFLPQSELIKYNYTVRLIAYYLQNGKKVYVDSVNNVMMNKQSQILFDIGYPNIGSGNYKLVIESHVSINNVITIETTSKIDFMVSKRLIDLKFDNLSFVYDANEHFPSIEVEEKNVFDSDLATFDLSFSLSKQKNVGRYTLEVYSNNLNYEISNSSKICMFEIQKKKLNIVWGNEELIYQAQSQTPKFKLEGICENDSVSINFVNSNFIDIGNYQAEIDIDSISNKNYYVEESKFDFVIKPAKVKIIFDDVTEKLKVAPNNRKEINFKVVGDIFVGLNSARKQEMIELMQIEVLCEGLSSLVFGKFDISATCKSKNFEIDVKKAVYNLIAPYKVVYTLPDGSIYSEEVEENGQPKGINRDIYNYNIFQVPEYSRELHGDGTENLYVVVTINDYTIFVIGAIIVVLFVVVYLIITRKQRRNKVS